MINVDLYNEIWDVVDWKKMNESPTENYMLMTNLDFSNEGNAVYIQELHRYYRWKSLYYI